LSLTIARESPVGPDLALLFERHTAVHCDIPPESTHMMDPSELDIPSVYFYVLRADGAPVAMGAFKRFSDDQGEIKSMHVLQEHRGQGLSRRMLAHILNEAKALGLTRLWLETGIQDIFRTSRILYEKAGFTECPPFGSYVLDPNSVFMTRPLA
jgi:putative acetyltransferase